MACKYPEQVEGRLRGGPHGRISTRNFPECLPNAAGERYYGRKPIEHDEETSLKLSSGSSLSPEFSHDFTTTLRFDNDTRGHEDRLPNLSRVQGRDMFQCTSSTQQDIALNVDNRAVHAAELNNLAAINPVNNTERRNPVPKMETMTTQLVMNIPSQTSEQKCNNTDERVGLAEHQFSFRSVPSLRSEYSPIHARREAGQKPPHPAAAFSPVPQPQFQPSSASSGLSFFSSDDNTQNMSLSSQLGQTTPTSQHVQRHGMAWLNSGSGPSGTIGGAGGNGRALSHSSSTSSLKSFIGSDSLVKKMSWKILKHVALTLQCKCSSASWKDLVERYGWDYDRTYLFENRPHQDGIFFSLLQEPEFQDYSLEQLRQDLFALPRRDILNDLNKLIDEHNGSASSSNNSSTQFY